MDVFWVRPDGSIGSNWWHEGHGWDQPYSLSPPLHAATGATAALSLNPDHMAVVWVSLIGSIGCRWWGFIDEVGTVW
jgi:hypothetical protein